MTLSNHGEIGGSMRALKLITCLALASGAAACASVVSGTSQTLTLDTVPAGADCSLTRKGLFVGRVNPTPGTVTVQRTRDEITVSCAHDGYETGTFVNKSGLEAATFGNIIFGGLVGVAIDSASGANNKYDATMRITLAPGAPGQDTVGVPSASAPIGARAPEHPMERAEFRCPTAGTTVRTSTGQQYKFTQANGMRCGYVDENGNLHERYALFADASGKMARSEMEGLWPLRVGSKVEFDISEAATGQNPYTGKSAPRTYHERLEIVQQQSVTVAAGKFDAFVVEWREKQFGAGRGEALITLWYAPQPGYFVKSSVQIIDGNSPDDPYFETQYSGMNYEATTVAVPGEG
jgi:hypothetical protein